MTPESVLDASALVAFLRKEAGAAKVQKALTASCISAVNLAEAVGKLVEGGKNLDEVLLQIDRLRIPIIPFDADQARLVVSMQQTTRHTGLSLGDRACLALAARFSVPALTAATAWRKCDLDVRVIEIR